jgi:hypothetical protein
MYYDSLELEADLFWLRGLVWSDVGFRLQAACSAICGIGSLNMTNT